MCGCVCLGGCDVRQVKPGWVENHYRWIVWKLAALERFFPEKLGGKYLTPNRVLEQLKYRYEREINRVSKNKKVLFLLLTLAE